VIKFKKKLRTFSFAHSAAAASITLRNLRIAPTGVLGIHCAFCVAARTRNARAQPLGDTGFALEVRADSRDLTTRAAARASHNQSSSRARVADLKNHHQNSFIFHVGDAKKILSLFSLL